MIPARHTRELSGVHFESILGAVAGSLVVASLVAIVLIAPASHDGTGRVALAQEFIEGEEEAGFDQEEFVEDEGFVEEDQPGGEEVSTPGEEGQEVVDPDAQPAPGDGSDETGAQPGEEADDEPLSGEGEPLEDTGEGEAVEEGEPLEEEAVDEGEEPLEGEAGTAEVPDTGASSEPQPRRLSPSEAARERLERLRRSRLNSSSRTGASPGARSGTGGSSRRFPTRTARPPGDTTPARPPAGPSDNTETSQDAESGAVKSGWLERGWIFVQENVTTVSIAAGGLLALLAALVVLRIRRRRRGEEEDEDIDLAPPGHYDDEEEGPRRVLIDPETGKPRDLPNRREKEYALVVDEEELQGHHGSLSDSSPGAEGEDPAEESIEQLIRERHFDRAYVRYQQSLRHVHGAEPVSPEIERVLGAYFLRIGDLEKATRVLEHYVETQPEDAIDARIYFDLAYLHFKRETFGKSRDYFRIFAAKERNPALTERARRVLTSLERVQNLN